MQPRHFHSRTILLMQGPSLGFLLAWPGLKFQGGFRTKGTWGAATPPGLLAGAAGVLIIRYGLKFIFPTGETFLAYLFRFIRYLLIGFWITGGAPWCFIRLKLAEKVNKRNITVSLLNDTGTDTS